MDPRFSAEFNRDDVLTEEEIDETAVDDGQEESEIGADGADNGAEEEVFTFTLTDDSGNEIEESYSQTELLDIINAHKSGGTVPDENLQILQPFLEEVRNSDFMKTYMQYKVRGHTDAEILDGLFLQRHPEFNQQQQMTPAQQEQDPSALDEPEYFNTISDEVQFHVKKALSSELSEIKNMLAQVSGKTAEYERQQHRTTVIAENDRNIGQALQTNGIQDVKDADLRAMYATLTTMYPGVDLNTFKLTPQQADLLVKLTFGANGSASSNGVASQMQNKRGGSSTEALVKQSKLPKVLPGQRQSSNPIANLSSSRSARSDALDKLFNWNQNQ